MTSSWANLTPSERRIRRRRGERDPARRAAPQAAPQAGPPSPRMQGRRRTFIDNVRPNPAPQASPRRQGRSRASVNNVRPNPAPQAGPQYGPPSPRMQGRRRTFIDNVRPNPAPQAGPPSPRMQGASLTRVAPRASVDNVRPNPAPQAGPQYGPPSPRMQGRSRASVDNVRPNPAPQAGARYGPPAPAPNMVRQAPAPTSSGGAAGKPPGRLTIDSTPERLRTMNQSAQASLKGMTNAPGQGPVVPNPATTQGWQNATVKKAAEDRGAAAQKARYEQKMGYLYAENTPATSDPTQDVYWQAADMAQWANANKKLARKLGWTPERSLPPSATGVVDYSGQFAGGPMAASTNPWSKEALAADSLVDTSGVPRFTGSAEGAEFSPTAWDPSTAQLAPPLQAPATAPNPADASGLSGFQFQGDLLNGSSPQEARQRAAVATGTAPDDEPLWQPEWGGPGRPKQEPQFDLRSTNWNPRMMQGSFL